VESEINFLEIRHVKLLNESVRGKINYIDAHALLASVRPEPVKVHLVWAFSDLGEHIRQHSEGTRPEVYLKPVEIAGALESLRDDALFILDVPRKQNKHVLNVGLRKVPYAVVALYLVGFRKVNVHSCYDEGFSSHLSYRWYLL
jgi:hypothetical protein